MTNEENNDNYKLLADKKCMELDIAILTEIALERYKKIEQLQEDYNILEYKYSECIASIKKWINVKDKLPELEDHGNSPHVLCLTQTGLIEKGFLDGSVWQSCHSIKSFQELGYIITHWQYLPPI